MGVAAKELCEWLDSAIKKMRPGDRLPTVAKLAKQFGLSKPTVVSALKKYQEKGLVSCVIGKGTFIAGKQPEESEPVAPAQSAAESLAQTILDSIVAGEYREGDRLPSVKFMSLRFNLAPATIIKAYELLKARNHVVKIGKAFWVGQLKQIVWGDRAKKVFLFNHNSTDFAPIFRDDIIAKSYQKLESELLAHGYNLIYADTAELVSNYSGIMKQNPYGFVFYRMMPSKVEEIPAVMKRLFRDAARDNLPVVTDWSMGKYPDFMKGTYIVSRGNMVRAFSRELASFLIKKGFLKPAFFSDINRIRPLVFIPALASIYSEIERLGRRFSYRIVEKHHRPFPPLSKMIEGMLRQNILDLLNKYKPRTKAQWNKLLQKVFYVTDDFANAYAPNTNASAWIFAHDDEAQKAVEWARANKIKVPEKLAIISTENDPHYYHYGLTYCGPDFEGIGYLMAHAIIGDFPVKRTARGFIQSRAHVLERLTT